jgi:hypothetical protein
LSVPFSLFKIRIGAALRSTSVGNAPTGAVPADAAKVMSPPVAVQFVELRGTSPTTGSGTTDTAPEPASTLTSNWMLAVPVATCVASEVPVPMVERKTVDSTEFAPGLTTPAPTPAAISDELTVTTIFEL